ncbi:apolipoprotein N-acyltransferase [Streptomyces sp. NPDC046821]|uniref:apolipoprotein N-acyltransferase n=1 Tax=Streptomyces sp. NPDC046821 TaxID=3154702 RepID=UPI0033C730AB
MDESDGKGRSRSANPAPVRPVPAVRALRGVPGGSTASPQSVVARLSASPWWRGAAAAVLGGLPVLVFPTPSLWWLAYVVLVPWMLLIRSAPTPRRATLDGWLGGFGFMFAVHHWLLSSLNVFTFVIAALLGVLWAPWGRLVRYLLGGTPSRGRAAAALVAVPSAWLMAELVRSWQGLGGPWGLLGSSQWQVPPALRVASVGGVWLLSLLVVAVNTAVTILLVARRARMAAVVGLVVTAMVTTAAWAWAPRPTATGRDVRVAVVQPGLIAGPGQRFDRQEALTRGLIGQHVGLVVWGESSVGFDLRARPDLTRRIAALSREVGAEILVNVDARNTSPTGPQGISKSSVLVGPNGLTGQSYDKMRLVPFGEYIPARPLFGWATAVGKGAASENRIRGKHQVVMNIRSAREPLLRIGPLICFETAFPDMTRNLTRDGAQVLVAQSSTSTFQNTWAPEQHATLAALRAAESGRPMVHATLTGESAVYKADGSRIGPRLGTSASTAHVYTVPMAKGTTLYVRYGAWPVHAAVLTLFVLGTAEAVRMFRRRSAAPHVRPVRTGHGSQERPWR